MKVKDLDFGSSGEVDLRSYCSPCQLCCVRQFLIYRRSSRSYYLYVKRIGFNYPFAHHRISAYADVFDVVNSTLAFL